jgi:hypothetical protein
LSGSAADEDQHPAIAPIAMTAAATIAIIFLVFMVLSFP